MKNSNKTMRSYITPSLRKADKRTLGKIGVSSFGSLLPYLRQEKPEIIEDFLLWTGTVENAEIDRQIYKYIVNYVEAFDRKDEGRVKTSSGLSITLQKPAKRLMPNEILEKVELIKNSTYSTI